MIIFRILQGIFLYLKQYMNKEAARQNNNYVADSFRYEPIGWDYGTTLYQGRGIYLWDSKEWAKRGTSYNCFNYPNRTNLSNEVIQKIKNFYKIVDIDISNTNPYICQKYINLSDDATLTDIYNANNGWGVDSFPNRYYGLRGPCNNRREGWDRYSFGRCNYVAYDFGKYYCGISSTLDEDCSSIQTNFINFLYSHSDYKAQVPIASSYGIMQMMYINAVDRYKWKKDEDSCAKEPSLLFDPDESLNLGARYDSEKMKYFGAENAKTFTEYKNSLEKGIQEYNPEESGYGALVISKAKNFEPKN